MRPAAVHSWKGRWEGGRETEKKEKENGEGKKREKERSEVERETFDFHEVSPQ